MKEFKTFHRPARCTAGLFATTALSALLTVLGSNTNANAAACLEEAYGGDLGCTANDISVAQVVISAITEGCDGSAGDTFTFDGKLQVQPSAQNRYDIGFYIGADPLASINDDCSVAVIPPEVSNIDNDGCGDTIGSACSKFPSPASRRPAPTATTTGSSTSTPARAGRTTRAASARASRARSPAPPRSATAKWSRPPSRCRTARTGTSSVTTATPARTTSATAGPRARRLHRLLVPEQHRALRRRHLLQRRGHLRGGHLRPRGRPLHRRRRLR